MVRGVVLLSMDGRTALHDLRVPAGPPGPLDTGPLGVWDSTLGRRLAYSDLTASGNVNVTVDGTVLRRLDILGTLTIRADNVRVEQCRIRPASESGTYTVNWANHQTFSRPPTGLVMVDTEIDGQGRSGGDTGPYPSGWAQSAAIQPGIDYTLRRCNIHGQIDNLKPQANPSPIVVERCWLHDPASYYTSAGNPTHNDSTQIAGAGVLAPVTVRECLLDGWRPNNTGVTRYASSSGCQFGSFPADDGRLVDVLFEDNWIDGGSYVSRFNAVGLAVVSNTVWRRNRIGLHHQFGAFSGTTSSLDGGLITAEGNMWWKTGTTDFGLAVIAGQAV